ncbi:hypothetical protein JCM16303_006393 [Sporobolomyces ruberrimus]
MSSEADVLAEIARLSSAIDQHKHYSAAPPRGRGRGRGSSYRGRGRGSTPGGTGGVPQTHRNATWVAPHLPQPSNPSTSRSGTTTPAERPEPSNVPTNHEKPSAPVPPPVTTREVSIGGVTFVADSRGNKLVRKTDSTPSTPSVEATPTPSTSTLPDAQSSTPRRTSHLGTTYIRTKSGNLVSLAFARDRKLRQDLLKGKKERLKKLGQTIGGVQGTRNKSAPTRGSARGRGGRGRGRGGFNRATRAPKPPKPKSDKLCIFFQKTGQCQRAHTCRYVHDSTKISICPLFLRSTCPRTTSTCPLSHHPNPHRSPHCSHFPSCTRPNCPYAHIVVSQDAKVCRDFVEYGWCEAGESCDKRHVRECWRFSEEGKCEVVGCKEPHVLRRVHSQESEEEDESSDEEDDEEGGEGEDDQEELEHQVEYELDKEEDEGKLGGGKRKRDNVGISGEAGRRLTKKLKGSSKSRKDLQEQSDYVHLSIPSSDLEEEEEEEDSDFDDVDSDDLAEDDEVEKQGKKPEAVPSPAKAPAASPSAATLPPTQAPILQVSSAAKQQQPVVKQFVKRKHLDQPPPDQTDELDYGLSSDDEEQEAAPEEEEVEEGNSTIYMDTLEGLDDDPVEGAQDQAQEEEEDSDIDDDNDVANLLRR